MPPARRPQIQGDDSFAPAGPVSLEKLQVSDIPSTYPNSVYLTSVLSFLSRHVITEGSKDRIEEALVNPFKFPATIPVLRFFFCCNEATIYIDSLAACHSQIVYGGSESIHKRPTAWRGCKPLLNLLQGSLVDARRQVAVFVERWNHDNYSYAPNLVQPPDI